MPNEKKTAELICQPVIPEELRRELDGKYERVLKKLAAIQEAQDTPAKTSGKFKYTPNGGDATVINIHTETKIATLIPILGFLVKKEEEYQAGADGLLLATYPPFTWLGYSVEQWKEDLGIRVRILSAEADRANLTEIKNTLSNYLSEETKVKNLLASLEGI